MDRERSGEPAEAQFREALPRPPAWPAAFIDDPRFWEELGRLARAIRAASSDGAPATCEITVGGAHLTAEIRRVDGDGQETAVGVVVPDDGSHLPGRDELRCRYRLTDREAEVALLLARRRTNKEIARALRVTVHTACRHTERVLGKLGISSRRDVQDAICASGRSAERSASTRGSGHEHSGNGSLGYAGRHRQRNAGWSRLRKDAAEASSRSPDVRVSPSSVPPEG